MSVSMSMYICPLDGCQKTLAENANKELVCACGARYVYQVNGTVLVFSHAGEGCNEFSVAEASERDNNHLHYLFKTYNTTNEEFRRKITSPLQITSGDTVLITAAGSGHDIPYIVEKLQGRGTIYAQDFSIDMLNVAIENCKTLQTDTLKIHFSISDAVSLPFATDFFDAAYHYGGINFFSNPQKGIAEMVRVVKDGASVVFGDEGVAPWLKNTDYGKMVIENNPLYICEAPLALLPQNIRDVNITWVLEHVHYLISMKKDASFPRANFDVEHVGIRGGTMHKRFHGKLEGIAPELRDLLYTKAREKGLSRVEILEQIITSYLGGEQNAS